MACIGFHAGHEQLPPSQLLTLVQQAEKAGFDAGSCSDHFHPWSERQTDSGYAWSWLGAALQATRLSFGTVCAPGQRYYPPIIAQAAATLAEMYPGRLWIALGSGEALNEAITGESWPDKAFRHQRLRESADVMRALWAGETVNHSGTFTVRDARLYTRPALPPMIVGAAITAETARWLGSWADALITVGNDPETWRKNLQAFREGGGAGKPVFLQASVCLARTEQLALEEVHARWRHCALPPAQLADLSTPRAFDEATRHITVEEVRGKVRTSCQAQEHCDWIAQAFETGFDRVYLNHVGRDVSGFIDFFGEKVLPHFRAAAAQTSVEHALSGNSK